MTTTIPYPWTEDSQFVTSPVVTGYLAITSPNGLYLNSKNILVTNGEVTATTFNGALNGNATTATNATNATNTEITNDGASSTTLFPVFVSGNTGYQILKVDSTQTPLSYVPFTSTLTATTFSGALSGTATRATNISGGLGGQIPYQSAVNTTTLLANGTAGQVLQSNGTTLAPSWITPAGSSTIPVTATDDGNTYFPTFVSATGSGQTLRADAVTNALSYVPSTSTLTATTFNGTATNATNAVIGLDNVSTLVYPTFVKTSAAGNKGLFIDDTTTALTYNPSSGTLTTTTFSGALSGNATTATTATNATNVAITEDSTTTTALYPVFVSDNTGNLPLKVDKTTTPLSYVPSTGTLTSTIFSGTATTANGVKILLDGTTNTDFPIAFANAVGNNQQLSADTTSGTGLFYNPSTETVKSTNFATGVSSTIGSSLSTTALIIRNSPSFTTTVNSNQITLVNSGVGTTTITPTSVTSTTFNGALSGNASTATNITGGLGGQIHYQSAVNTTALLANGTAGQFLQSNGTTLAPSWVNQNLAATASGIPVSGGTQSATLTVNFNNSFSSVTRYALTYSPSGTNVYTINNYALSGGVSGGQYTLTIEITIPSNAGITYTFNGTGLTTAPVPKTNFTTVSTGNVNGPTIRYIVLTFVYNGTNYYMSASNFT